MTNLPSQQIGESQRLSAKLQVQPDAKIMQPHFGSQASLKAIEGMGSFPNQAEGVEQLVVDGFHDLTQTCQPVPPGFGPFLFTALMGRADNLCGILVKPASMQLISGEAFVGQIDALGGRTGTEQPRAAMVPDGEKGFGQAMVVATGWGKAKASNDSHRRNRGKQMKTLIPANAIAPADIGLPSQPTAATSLGISSWDARTVQDFIQAALSLQMLDQVQSEGHDDIAVPALQAVELAAIWQTGKSRSQVLPDVAVEGPFAGKVRPLVKKASVTTSLHDSEATGPRQCFSW